MPALHTVELIAAGHAAMNACDFDAAARSFEQALEAGPSGEAYDGLAWISYAADDFEAAVRRWELAYRTFKEEGDLRRAGRIATNLGACYYDAFCNESASQGWLARASRLLDQAGRCVERGHLALALVGCNVRDANALEQSAAVALELATEFQDADLEARALADGGLALVNQGRIAQGFARLDEAMAAVSSGEVSPIYAGKIYCAMLSACERTGDARRAEEWTTACRGFMDKSLPPGKLPVLHAHCRIAYGIVLCDSGRWNEAETELLHALGPSRTNALSEHAHAVGALASLRILQGRIEDAAEALTPYADRFEVCEPMARLHLTRSEPDLAVAVLTRALNDLIGDRLRAARLLSLLVEAELARDNLEGAERAHERLQGCAEASESVTVRAASNLAAARIAKYRSDWTSAIVDLTAAAGLIRDDDRPVLVGRIHFQLADVLAKTGDTATAVAEGRSALAVFERLGANREADQVAALLRSLGAGGRSRGRERDASVSSLTAREKEVFALLGEGLTNAEIAQRLFITPKTVEHHVGRILAKLGVRSRTEAATVAAGTPTPA